MDFNLSAEQKLLQDTIFQSVRKIDPTLPLSIRWKQIAATGIVGINVGADYGGSGLGALDMLLAFESLGKANVDNGLSFSIAAHTLACVIPIYKYGSVAQKAKYIPGLLNGEIVAANAMTESESGSDVYNLQCKAIKNGSDYTLNGTKTFISNSANSGIVLTYASTHPDKGFFGGITAFIVEKGNYSTGTEFNKMGLESCSLGEIIFDNTNLTDQDILGNEGGGGIIFNHSMEWERICLTGIHIGAMFRVLDKTIEFVKQRKSSGQSIGKYQAVAHAIADMQVSLEVARTYSYKAAWVLDNQKNVSREAAIVKLFVSNTLKNFMLQAMQIFGGYGYVSDYGIEQEVRDALASTIYSGTSEIQKNIIASNIGI